MFYSNISGGIVVSRLSSLPSCLLKVANNLVEGDDFAPDPKEGSPSKGIGRGGSWKLLQFKGVILVLL